MKIFFISLLILISKITVFASINPKNIEIIRDQWGGPHIYAPTDEEVAYGLAWATAEDDFKSMQENFLAIHGRLAEIKGKDGAIMDFMAAFVGARKIAIEKYDKALSPKFKGIVEAYTQGVNDYINKHPEKLLIKEKLEVTPQDMIAGYVLGMVLMTNVQYDLINISNGKMYRSDLAQVHGSNGIAVSGNRTNTGKSFLAINSHQPLEGPYSWYEAHLHSDEGWNMLGGTFPGGITIFHGVNENLGWAHTVNFNDLCDVYKLKMHPSKKLFYEYDGKWLKLKEEKVKLKVKVWFFKIPITKRFYISVYGPTMKSDEGFFAMRFPANMDVRSAEQWYWMNKAKNKDEFMTAIKMHAAAGLNIVYADKQNNIMFIDNNQFPKRGSTYNWKKVLPGNTSKTLWKANDYYNFDVLKMDINPPQGFVFNSNNSAFNATGKFDTAAFNNHPLKAYYYPYETNRSIRFSYLFSQYKDKQITWNDFLTIKYDQTIHTPAYIPFFANFEAILQTPIEKYPEVKDIFLLLKKWDKKADVNSNGAAIVALLETKIGKRLFDDGWLPFLEVNIKEKYFFETLEEVKKEMLKNFGTLEVKLGDVQKLVRGKKELPMSGIIDVIAAMSSVPYKDGMIKAEVGESYIALVRFTDSLPYIESISPYGTSNVPGNKHYDDQMELYTQKKRKIMSMDYKFLIKNAERIYHPL
jgi:acyl-homoserine-lactone acylase